MLVGWHRGWLHPQLTWPSSARWSSWGAYRASNRIDDRHSLIESNLNQLQLQTQPASPTPARHHKYIRYDLDAGDLGRNPFIYQSIHLQQLNTLSSQPDPTSTISASTDSWANVACARATPKENHLSPWHHRPWPSVCLFGSIRAGRIQTRPRSRWKLKIDFRLRTRSRF